MNTEEEVLNLWYNCNDGFPNNIPHYTEDQQQDRELEFETSVGTIKSVLKRSKGSYQAVRQEKEQLLTLIGQIFRSAFGFKDEEVEMIFSASMVSSTLSFTRAVLKYEPDLKQEAIFQALRNVWIMNGLQQQMNCKVEITPSVFAYSMLYPYTDNYLDDPSISFGHKFEFVERFADRLAGKLVVPENRHEERIFEMVELIEREWEREAYPEVYQSLLDIHAAQADSIRLMMSTSELDFDQRLAISIRKGGTSVVADGYLVKGTLSPEEHTFLYGYGAYLQLLDDLQDLETDRAEGLWTAFSVAAQNGCLDHLLNKVYWFGETVVKQAKLLRSPDVDVFQALMKRSFEMFLIDAVRSNKSFFSESYVLNFQKRLPFRAPFINKVSTDANRLRAQLSNRLFREAVEYSQSMEFPFLKRKSPLEVQQA